MFRYLLLIILMLTYTATASAEEPIGTLIIPSLRLYKPIDAVPLVDRGYDLTELGYGVGFLEGTSWEDTSWGRTVLVGHTPGGFQTLDKLQNGAIIYVLTDNYTLTYEVTGQYVTTPDDVGLLNPTDTPSLVLMTCTNGITERRIIIATLKEYH
jgi:LPXTG-site transpeptidase (sortase) family protein